jgi:23S rRNA (guanosine2251-2'-O)-methyltransferase
LVLDVIQDPHNFGAILRTAEAFSVDAVIITKDNSVKVTETVRKVASGAAEIIPIVEVTNLSRFLQTLKDKGVWIVGSILDINAQSLYKLDLTMPIALIVGSEGQGIKQLTVKNCDFLAYIPLSGSIESLNVSVATGILLAEVQRQRL